MINLSKVTTSVVVGLTALAVSALSVAPVFADSPGQLTDGSHVFQVKNLTQGGAYASTVNTACGDTIQYSTMLHNAAFGGLTNVQVSANLANGTVVATPAEGATTGTNGSVTVNVASGGNLVYENDSTILYNQSGAVVRTLPNTITSGGVNIGTITGSTTVFVNFKAKVNCPVTPKETPKETPKKETPKATPTPEKLPSTGPGAVAGLFAGASAVGTAAHYFVSRRRNQ